MEKNDYIDIFNSMLKGIPVSFNEKIFPMIVEYLTEINCENIEEKIYLIRQNPSLANNIFPELVDYYCNKYDIIKVNKPDKFNNLKTIMYYG